jgi:protein gp37
MGLDSKIEWTETTWNPITGCTKVSAGCANCYAERLAYRLKAMGQKRYQAGFNVSVHNEVIDLPLNWKKPQMIFVNSMSDLFHEHVSEATIRKIFRVMNETPQHIYQVLTKRSERMKKLSNSLQWTNNIWMGVSVESQKYIHRIDDLLQTEAYIKFISFEPLIKPINGCNLRNIDWVIVGGESGPKARPMKEEWVLEIKEKCQVHGIPFFFKQWGGVNKYKTGRILNGRTWDEIPNITNSLL